MRVGAPSDRGPLVVVGSLERGVDPWRWPRAAAFAVATVSLTSAAHRLGHGVVPPWTVLLAAAALITLGAMPLVRREQRFGGIAIAMLALQGALHVLFTRWPGGSPSATHDALHHPDMVQTAGFQHDVTMLFAHAAAACVLAWWLRRGEARLWAVARAAGRTVVLLFRVPPAIAAPPLVLSAHRRGRVERRIGRRRLLALRSSVVLRAPPGPVAVRP